MSGLKLKTTTRLDDIPKLLLDQAKRHEAACLTLQMLNKGPKAGELPLASGLRAVVQLLLV